MTMPKKRDPPRRPRLPAEHCSRDFQRYQYSLGSPRVIAYIESRLVGIVSIFVILCYGLSELQCTILSLVRRREL
jgi:hypothetical protein